MSLNNTIDNGPRIGYNTSMKNEEIIDAIATKLQMFETDSLDQPKWETDEEEIHDIVDEKSPMQMKYFLLDICELIEESDSLATYDPDMVLDRHEEDC